MSGLNLAGRAGKWSAENWKKALFGWLVFAVAAMTLGGVVGHVQMVDSQFASGETAKAMQLIESANFKRPSTEVVLIQSPRLKAGTPVSSPRSPASCRPSPARKTSRTSRTRS
jgi:hypothetical protein